MRIEVTQEDYFLRIADSYPRTCPQCKTSMDDGHYFAKQDVCAVIEEYLADQQAADEAEEHRWQQLRHEQCEC